MRRAALAATLLVAACGTSSDADSPPAGRDLASCCLASGAYDPDGATYLLEDGRGVAIERSGRRVQIPGGILVATTPDGTAYVATADGTLLAVRQGTVTRRVHVGGNPAALVALASGATYVADQSSPRVSRVAPSGSVTVARLGGEPTALAAAPDGTVYATTADPAHFLIAIRPDGTSRVAATAPAAHRGEAVAVARDGTVYATASTDAGPGVIAVLAPGRPTRLLAGVEFPGPIAVRADGRALVADGDGVRVIGAATIPLGRAPHVVVAATDSNRAWAATSRAVWSLDGAAEKVFDVPDDNDGPPTLAVAPPGTQYPGALYIGTQRELVIIETSGARHVLPGDPHVLGIAFA